MHSHHVFDTVIAPLVGKVCSKLRMEREDEIHDTSVHRIQMRGEMACYENSLQDIRVMLKKNMGYMSSPQFQRIQQDVEAYLAACDGSSPAQ